MDLLSANLLLVDDYAPLRRTLRGLLLQIGFRNIDETGTVDCALEKMRERNYGLILSDFDMGEKSGLDLLGEMRADDDLKDTRFLMVSGLATAETVAAAKEAGVDGFIVKPFNMQTLKRQLQAVLNDSSAKLI